MPSRADPLKQIAALNRGRKPELLALKYRKMAATPFGYFRGTNPLFHADWPGAAWLERIAQGATPGCYPVALAVNFAVQGLPDRDAFVVHQYGVATMILSAALRLMKVSHVDTQRILYELNADAEAAYAQAARSSLTDMAGFAPLLEILAAVHVKAHLRLFMN